jgi:hypothetical protein
MDNHDRISPRRAVLSLLWKQFFARLKRFAFHFHIDLGFRRQTIPPQSRAPAF